MKLAVRLCRGCGRDMISQYACHDTPALRQKYVVHGAHGMCGTCYGRARKFGTSPDPAPRKGPVRPYERDDRLIRPCRDCGHDMISKSTWCQRPDLRQAYRRADARGLCRTCYNRSRKGDLARQRAQEPALGAAASWACDLIIAGPADTTLTGEQQRTLALIALGHTDKDIAALFCMQVNGVKTRVHRMFRTLGARDRAHAVAIGFRTRLLRTHPLASYLDVVLAVRQVAGDWAERHAPGEVTA